MLDDKIGACSQNLYAQFIYRVCKFGNLFNNNVSLSIFAPMLYLTGSTYEHLRDYLFNTVEYTDGFLLRADSFADVKGDWGITFCLFKANTTYINNRRYHMTVNSVDISGVKLLRQKSVYNIDGDTLTDWMKQTCTTANIVESVMMTSAINYKPNKDKGRGNFREGSLGYMWLRSNNVEKNQQFVSILSSAMYDGNGVNIFPDMFRRVCVYFTARRLITGPYATWINCKDEYMIPNMEHADYAQFEADSIVYSLFNNASNQSSLRNIVYNGKQWDIKNEFFWLSRQEMWQLTIGSESSDDINNEVEQDLYDNADDERYVYKELQRVTLSSDAKAVLDKATELIHKSFKYRKVVSEQHPEYHLNTWDMGYYQLNKLIQEIPSLSEEWKEFRALYKTLEDRMRPLVYELGFLYK